jgi:hypothetical protein
MSSLDTIALNIYDPEDIAVANRNPSEVFDEPWIYAERKIGKYPEATSNSGKWLIFVYEKNLDLVWEKIKSATENGTLGQESKTSTGRRSSLAPKPGLKVICVYTYDSTDKEDVIRIRKELRMIGIESKIPYKMDDETRKGNYTVSGGKRIARYYE